MTAKKVKHPTMLEVAHEMAKDLFKANVIDAATMREFDVLCFTPLKDEPSQKTAIGLRQKKS